MTWPKRLFRLALGRRFPKLEGRLDVPGVRDSLLVRRDQHGVAYVKARSEHDAWFGLGFCHAQDRAAQLELTVRAVRGTLSELVGSEGLPIDRLSRRIGFRSAGDRQLALADRDVADQVAAYVRGVNAGLTHGVPTPHELALLRRKPTPWEPGDVQGYCVLLCFALASNWDVELIRLKLLLEDGPRALALLDAPYPAELPVSFPSGEPAGDRPKGLRSIDALAEELERFGQWFGRIGGSNAWALAPHKTQSGRPLLANDPHLPSAVPPLVYLAQLRCPDLEAAGASWVGLPAFAPGHNGVAAWGATAAHADNTDLFLEVIGSDGACVREGDGWKRCKLREERILVNGAPAALECVLVTPRGPIISPALDEAPSADGFNAISLAATWLASRPYRGLYAAPRARTFAEFRANFAQGSASTVSYVYADTSGSIGWHIAVEVPRRVRPGALLPRPGWDPEARWHDTPHLCTELPYASDPPEGFVCTANNQPVPEPHADLGVDWLDGYRQAAIAEALAARDDWDAHACEALQRDTTSLPWRRLGKTVLDIEPKDADAREAQSLLGRWDGRVAADSIGASVYCLFVTGVTTALARRIAPRAWTWAVGRGFNGMLPHSTIATRRLAHLVRLVTTQPPDIVDDWPALLEAELGGAVRWLRLRAGRDSSSWRWGSVRPLTLVHAFGSKPPLDRVFNVGPMDGEGDPSTIAQGGLDLADPAAGQLWAPTLRAVFDVGAWEACRFALAGGQSGNPLSPHYADQLSAWRLGPGVPIAWSEERIARCATRVLTLTPLRASTPC